MTPEEKQREKKRREARWNRWNLIPTKEEGYEVYEEVEHAYKQLLYEVCKGIPSEITNMYKNCSLVYVYELLMHSIAYNW